MERPRSSFVNFIWRCQISF